MNEGGMVNKSQYVFARYGFLFGIGLICVGFFLGVMINIGNDDVVGIFCVVGFTVMILAGIYVHSYEWDIDFYRIESGSYVDSRKITVRKAIDHSSKNGYVWKYHID